MARPLYITTTLPYVNSDPHIGFALEIVHADIYARYRKLQGDDVFFNTGTDEHGQKIFEAARKAGKEPSAYVDEYAAKFRALKDVLGLSQDIHFIRTTDPHHVAAAQEMWKRCEAAGDIYPKTYTGLYCVGCEAFKTEKEIVDGKCTLHPSLTLTEVSEKNYFFKLSKYQDQLREYLSQPGVIVPEWRREEALKFVEDGLEDISISREKKDGHNEWGIPVPGDDSQTMYVWFDALTNYISTLGWPEEGGDFKKFWVDGDTMQMAGKDQVRFQSIIWQAMLMSAQLPRAGRVVYHGFITSGGQKMSKSLGNVIDPLSIVEEYGTDALRYFLARHVHPFEDTDVTMEKFKEVYNADLANGLGNLVSRVMKMATSNGVQSREQDLKFLDREWEIPELDRYEVNQAIESIWSLITTADSFIQTSQPFKTIKTDRKQGETDIKVGLLYLIQIAVKLGVFLPTTSKKIEILIRENKMPESPLFLRKE
ncbi:MAG TPA: methionine--tRNA ligase [Candidatus Paceibacterota bacterium]|nr:methionine--tRNA ligase [Candidatus Paceibacterota bacterium]